MSFSNYLENELLDYIISHYSVYIALSKANPGEDGSGLDELSGCGYARASAPSGDWNAAADGSKDNKNKIEFPEATCGWDTVSYIALCDASSGGNVLMSTALSSSVTVLDGCTAFFDVGDLEISLT